MGKGGLMQVGALLNEGWYNRFLNEIAPTFPFDP